MTAVLLVCEHSATMGLGHVARTSALAAELERAGCRPTLVAFGPPIASRVAAPGVVITVERDPGSEGARAARVAELARECRPRAIVVDVPRIGERALRDIHALGATLAVMGDPTDGEIPCDVLVHASATRPRESYAARTPAGTRLLLGPRYAVLRDSILRGRDGVPAIAEDIRTVFVGLGGGDVEKDAVRVVEALRQARAAIHIDLVMLGWRDDERAKFAGDPRLHLHTGGGDVAPLMARADVGVATGGITSLELACLGVPSLVVVRAPNQQATAALLAGAGVALDLGPIEAVDGPMLGAVLEQLAPRDRRALMRERGRGLVDGLGARRVAEELLR